MSRNIKEGVRRKLYAASLGRCMNPACAIDLFGPNGDIIEKAHIDAYCETADNSYENLVILCPNCHTNFDKNHAYTPQEVLGWKAEREREIERVFGKALSSFELLKEEVRPLLLENKTIYENYYLGDNKTLWDKFEPKVLINNKKIRKLLSANMGLFQSNQISDHSNNALVQKFLLHIDEFEATRLDDEKSRQVLFPEMINSIFDIEPVEDSLLPMTESLEALFGELEESGLLGEVVLGVEKPYFEIIGDGRSDRVWLNDVPRLRQLYYDYSCFRKTKVRFESLNFALSYIRSKGIDFSFPDRTNLRVIRICGRIVRFVYEYCLGRADLLKILPVENCVIVNLHNWNGESCISAEAYDLAEMHNIDLLTMEGFYRYVRSCGR